LTRTSVGRRLLAFRNKKPSRRAQNARLVRIRITRLLLNLLVLSLAVSVALPTCAATTTLVAKGSVWKYLDNGTDPGSSWKAANYFDGGWAAGPAQLGYGDGDEATVISYGTDSSNRYLTTYFRQKFSVANPATLGTLTLSLLRDDGAIVYLNGTEVFRSNMPAGPVTASTRSTAAAGGTGETTFFTTTVSPTLLAAGTNVLAVELHQSDPTTTDASFDLSLTAGTGPTLTRGPYLQMGTPDSMVVRWRTSQKTDSAVRYGVDPGVLTQITSSASSVTEHELRLTGLVPATKYYYAVGSTIGNLSGPTTNEFFVTAPPVGSSPPVRIWVLGDSGRANDSARAVRDAYYGYTGTRRTDLWLMLGDNAYDNGTEAEYQAAVFNMYPDTLRTAVLWPTLGNHDTASSHPNTQTGPYFDAFTLPKNAEAGGLASETEAYYSFDYANIHFISLNSGGETSRSVTGSMHTWLQADLASTGQRWVIAYWHHPPYSKGSNDSDVDTKDIQMRTNFVPLLEQYGVDLVLGGHSHSYERSFLIDGHYGLSSTFSASMKKDAGSGRESKTGAYSKPGADREPHAGAVYMVAGNAGEIQGGKFNHPAIFFSRQTLGSVVLDVNGSRLDARMLDSTGVVCDSFTIIKGGTGQVPAAPNGLTATALSSTNVQLNWSDQSSNESGFKIERSVNGGASFTQIATTGTGATTYSDTTVTAGMAHQYRVRAFNSAGNSAYSNTAGVTTPGGGSGGALVPAGSVWKYLDNGSNQGTAWRAPAFNDSVWLAGPAQLGYGDGDEATVVGHGPSGQPKYITTYFRRSFNVTNPVAFSSLTLTLLRDDGAVVYLNGSEIVRSNMPAGTLFYTTLAASPVSGNGETRPVVYTLSPSVLVAGTNVLAVEIHQDDPWSSDISFDLELTVQ